MKKQVEAKQVEAELPKATNGSPQKQDYAARCGRAIRIARAVAGMPKKELAKKARCDASYICLIEQGKREPTRDMLSRIAAALDVHKTMLDLLIEGELLTKEQRAKEPLLADAERAWAEVLSLWVRGILRG